MVFNPNFAVKNVRQIANKLMPQNNLFFIVLNFYLLIENVFKLFFELYNSRLAAKLYGKNHYIATSLSFLEGVSGRKLI